MRRDRKPDLSHRKNERGSVLAYTVISALFLFLAVGLSADLSHLYLVKTELQNTADAAALAGASALSIPIDNPDRIQTAVNRALDVMNSNKYNLNNKNYGTTQRTLVKFAINLNGTYKTEGALTLTERDKVRFVHVKTPDVPVSTFFYMPFFPPFERKMDAEATAGLSVAGNANFCPAPLAVLECGADNPQCLGPDPDGEGPKVAPQYSMGGICNAGGPAPNPDGSACDPNKQFCKNCVYTIRAAPSDGPAPGNYHALCCPGVECDAAWLRRRIAAGNNCEECPPVAPGQEVDSTTKPGELAGPIRQGINTRFDMYQGGLDAEDFPPDPNIFGDDNDEILTYSQYKTGTPLNEPKNTPEADRRKIILPITPFSSWFDGNGRTTVRISSLQGFFIQARVPNGSGDLRAEFVGDEVIAGVGLGPGPSTTNVVTWVLYR